MKVEKDYEELLKLFNKHKVKYCIIGAYAVAFYAKPRYTKDMDILVEPSIKNGQKIVNALNEFGFKSLTRIIRMPQRHKVLIKFRLKQKFIGDSSAAQFKNRPTLMSCFLSDLVPSWLKFMNNPG